VVELGVRTLFVGGGHQSVSLALKPFTNAQLILGRAQKLWDFPRVLMALFRTSIKMKFCNFRSHC